MRLIRLHQVRTVNGVTVKNLSHMKELVEGGSNHDAGGVAEGGGGWIEVELEGSRLVVVPLQDAQRALAEIMQGALRVVVHTV